MRRRAARNSRLASRTRSWPRNRISPEVGSTSRLMQRTSVDLPVPEGPMMAVRPRPSIVRETSRSTGSPAPHSLRSLRIRSDRSLARSTAGWLRAVVASMASAADQGLVRVFLRSWRCFRLLLLFLGGFRLALAFGFVSVFVVWRTRPLRDLAHDLPGLLVSDRH